MTANQKTQILSLRLDGLSYSQIAQRTRMSENTVKSCCRRNEMNNNLNKDDDKTYTKCKNCGKALEHLPNHRSKKFCSDACRFNWWNKTGVTQQGSSNNLICKNCGKEFKSRYIKNRKFCSHDCYVSSRFGK